MTQKVLKVGSSAAVTIPKRSLLELGLKIGDEVAVEIDRENKTVIIEPSVKIDREFLRWTDRFIKKYKPALKELARK